jgi:endonuclease YncB( thermonuclease family)
MIKARLLIFLFFLFLSCGNNKEYEIENQIKGQVIKIKDGDTIDILFNGKPLTIRFAHIDCPEKKQPFGMVAKKFIAEKCFGKIVTILNENKFDRNKRLIGVLINDQGENLNKELLKAGLAWHYLKYSNDTSYSNLEAIARLNKIRIWSDPNPTAPWVWRNGRYRQEDK